eukprot:scaffold45236_cov59-Cyclotella_meneghiniana.AAC.6
MMVRSKTSVVLLILQCCWAFHSPKQWAGKINRGFGHAMNKQSKLASFQVPPDTVGDSEDLPTSARDDIGEVNYGKKLGLKRQIAVVGAPQTLLEDEDEIQISKMNITQVMTELQAIQSQGPKKYCILGTRHCSFLHQQIVEMLTYALVLSGNHVFTSGAQGTNAAAIRGALRAFQPNLLTVVLPQSMSKQTLESQDLLQDVTNVITMPQNDQMPLDVASRICNSHLLSQTDHLISFAFHESTTVLEAAEEAHKLEMLVTLLYLD